MICLRTVAPFAGDAQRAPAQIEAQLIGGNGGTADSSGAEHRGMAGKAEGGVRWSEWPPQWLVHQGAHPFLLTGSKVPPLDRLVEVQPSVEELLFVQPGDVGMRAPAGPELEVQWLLGFHARARYRDGGLLSIPHHFVTGTGIRVNYPLARGEGGPRLFPV
jgi:hypothetical protein